MKPLACLSLLFLVACGPQLPGSQTLGSPTPSLTVPVPTASPTPTPKPAATETKEVFQLPGGRLFFSAYRSEDARQTDPVVAEVFAGLAYYPWLEEYFWLNLTDRATELHPILTGLYPTQDRAVAMSPDWSLVAFERTVYSRPNQASSSMYASHTAGGESEPIGRRFTGDSVLGTSWSSDSRVFAYWTSHDWEVLWYEEAHGIYLWEVDARTRRTVTLQAMQPATAALSADGTQIAFSAFGDAPGMYLINADGSDQHVVVEGAIDWIAWHPDRSHILFAEFSPQTGIFSYDIVSGAVTSISPVGKRALGPSVSPDGSLIAYESNGIYVVGIEGGNAVQLTGGGMREWLWSPNSQYLAYNDLPYNGISQIFVMDALGNGRVVVSPNTLSPVELIGWLPE
jgi:Tol biopolymer transport system component